MVTKKALIEQLIKTKHMKLKFIYSLILVVLLTESCSTAKNTMENKNENTTAQHKLSGTYTVHFIDKDEVALKTLKLTFNADTNKISGFAGCNSFFGTYTVSQNHTIAFTNIGATKKYCLPEFNTVERNFMKALGSVNSFLIQGTNLSLLQNKVSVIKATKAVAVSTKQAINDSTEVHNNLQRITYKTTSRGAFNYVSISETHVLISKDANLKSIDKYTCNKKDFETLTALLKQTDILNLQKLEAPTKKRFYDGAPHATLDVTLGDKVVRSASFDHGHPPKEIEALVNKVLSIKENAVK